MECVCVRTCVCCERDSCKRGGAYLLVELADPPLQALVLLLALRLLRAQLLLLGAQLLQLLLEVALHLLRLRLQLVPRRQLRVQLPCQPQGRSVNQSHRTPTAHGVCGEGCVGASLTHVNTRLSAFKAINQTRVRVKWRAAAL